MTEVAGGVVEEMELSRRCSAMLRRWGVAISASQHVSPRDGGLLLSESLPTTCSIAVDEMQRTTRGFNPFSTR